MHILRRSLSFSAMFLLAGANDMAVAASQVSDEAQHLHREMLVLDSHLDTPARLDDPAWSILDRHTVADNGSQVDLPRMIEGGLDGGFWVAFTPQGPLEAAGYAHARKHAMDRLTAIGRMVAGSEGRLALAEHTNDASMLAEGGKMLVYRSMENAYPLGEDVGALEQFRDRGVRMLGLVHMANNQFADSANDPAGPRWHGLSPAGRALIAEANRLGIVVDLSHASDEAFDQAIALSSAPILLSHSGCRDLFDRPRNIDDARIQRLAASGGVIQVSSIYMTRLPPDPARDAAVAKLLAKFGSDIGPDRQAEFDADRAALNARFPVPRPTFDDFMDNLLHALRLVGPRHVGVGVDWDGGSDVDGFADVTMLPKVTERLMAAGYSRADIENIWGGNLLRVVREAERQTREDKQ